MLGVGGGGGGRGEGWSKLSQLYESISDDTLDIFLVVFTIDHFPSSNFMGSENTLNIVRKDHKHFQFRLY